MSKFSNLQEARPAWPGFDVMLYARFEDSRPREITEDEFLSRIAGRIHHLGRWESPKGPARVFFVGYEGKDSYYATAITLEARPTFYLLIPAPVGGAAPVRRRLAE